MRLSFSVLPSLRPLPSAPFPNHFMTRNISRPTRAIPPKEIPTMPHVPRPSSSSPPPSVSSLSPPAPPPSSSSRTTALPVTTYDHTPSFS
eukprot:1192744-Prorocentrum_minimum.AAC.1